MHTKPGDRVGEPERDAKVIEVRGCNGQPPYVVEWSGDGRVGQLARAPEGSG